MVRRLSPFPRNMIGVTAIEHGHFAALISVAIMGALFRLGDSVADPVMKI